MSANNREDLLDHGTEFVTNKTVLRAGFMEAPSLLSARLSQPLLRAQRQRKQFKHVPSHGPRLAPLPTVTRRLPLSLALKDIFQSRLLHTN